MESEQSSGTPLADLHTGFAAEGAETVRQAREHRERDPMTDTYWLKVQDERVEKLEAALRELAGDYGCTLLVPADPSLPPSLRPPCREMRPNEPHTWCYACVASDALDDDRWRCPDCTCLNADTESGCYRCGAGRPEREERRS